PRLLRSARNDEKSSHCEECSDDAISCRQGGVMRAVRCHKFAPSEVRGVDEFESPALRPEQARIRVHAAGINFADTLMVAGKYQIKPPFPFTPGLEVGGEVIEVGAAVEPLRPRQRVLGVLRRGGGYADEAVADAAAVVPIPDR